MAKSVITDKGKGEVLRLAFKGSDANSAFDYMALGGSNSNKVNGGEFVEVTDMSYRRVQTEVEDSTDDKNIQVSAIFDETNLNSSDGESIKEIGLVNSSEYSSDETFFAYCQVPEIVKDDNISLKYTIIIELE